jgi:ATP-binding cassette subfamily B protein
MYNLSQNLSIFIWHFLKHYKWKVCGIYLAVFIASFFAVIDPYLLKILIDKITSYKDHFRLFDDGENLILVVFLFITFNVCSNLIWRIINYLSIKIFPEVRLRVFSETFSYVSAHSHQYFQDNLAGDLVNKIQNIGESIEDIFTPMINIVNIFFIVLIAIFIANTINIYFSLALIMWVILFMIISIMLSKDIIHYSKDLAQINSILSGKYVDSLMNIFNVSIFARQEFEKSYLEGTSYKVMTKDIALRWKLLKLWTIQGILCSLILAVMIFILIYLRSKDIVTTGDFVFIISITIMIINYIFGIAELISRILEKIGICNQAISAVYVPHKIIDTIAAIPLQIKKAEIVFENVNFGYKQDNIFLQDFNIIIPANQKVGLVGYSGSGKTTFVNLLIRLFDIQKGEIKIDQQNIKHVTQSSLRENIAFIPQNPILFHRSFMENIRYGKLDATDAEVVEAAKKAHAHEFIHASPQGYDSLIGENGIKISGGQRQRLAIARAILKNAPILILDEATSSLDSVTETFIQESLKELMQNKTVIIIAHRLSTLLTTDRILVFDQGKIVEDGAHKELLSKNRLYKILWDAQVGGFLGDHV